MAAMHGFTIGRGDRIQVDVHARAYPDLVDFWDGNWLVTPVTARVGGFRADVPDALLRADEISAFRDELRDLDGSLSGTARLSSLEEWVDVTVTGDGSGRFDVTGEIRDRPGSPRRLAFTLDDYDQSDLPALLTALDEVLAAFPVRGTP